MTRLVRKNFARWCLVSLLIGCGGNPNLPKLMPVRGTVTLDGKPLPSAMLSFIPVGSTRGTGAGGLTDQNGKYELVARHGGKGAAIGNYRVTVIKWAADGSTFPAEPNIAPLSSPTRQGLPAKHTTVDGTVLTATVHDGDNTIDFPLSSKP